MTRTLRHFAIAVLLSGCTVPPLDTTGKILCDTDGGCPTGFNCVGAVCCPSGTGQTGSSCEPPRCTMSPPTCPSGLTCTNSWCCPSTSNSDYQACIAGYNACDHPPNGGAWAGPTTAGAGGTCPVPTSGVGTQCTVDMDCHTNPPSGTPLVCAIRSLGGYCTTGCDPSLVASGCPAGSLCDVVEGDHASIILPGLCVRECSLPPGQTWAHCRFGSDESHYVCVTPDGSQDPVCIPDCVDNPAVCPSTRHCDATRHVCVAT